MAAALLWPVLGSAAFWLLASLLVGLLANRLPLAWLRGQGRADGQREGRSSGGGGGGGTGWRHRCVGGASSSGTVTRRGAGSARGPLAIRRWKRWIPDAGGALPGGVAKASLVRRDPLALERLLLETRRAELVHWVLLPAGLLTALWLPPVGVVVNGVFALLFNLPCVLLQYDTRTRLRRCLARIEA